MPRIARSVFFAALRGELILLAPFAAGASAQDVLLTLQGDVAFQNLGINVAAAEDVNADGFDDVIVHGRRPAEEFQQFVRVVSGADGSTLYEFCEPGIAHFGADSAGIGDVNGDGHGDILVGAPQQGDWPADFGSVFLYSGADGSLIYEVLGPPEEPGNPPYYFGTAVDAMGDLDGDGVPDFVVGLPVPYFGLTSVGHVHVYSGATGTLLLDIAGDPYSHDAPLFGERVAGIGDVDADGLPDVAASSFLYCELGDFSQVHVFSGADGSPLQFIEYGCSYLLVVGAAGDVDGDGHSDIVIGRPSYAGIAEVYSGADGSKLLAVTGSGNGDEFGQSVAGLGDLDRDGHDDVLVGAPNDYQDFYGSHVGLAVAISGRTGASLWTLSDGQLTDRFGESVANVGDVNGDGFLDLAVGAPRADTGGTDAGRVIVVSGYAPWWDIGDALAGSHGLPQLKVEGRPVANEVITVQLDNALPLGSAFLVFGASLAKVPFAGGVLVPSVDGLLAGLAIDASGSLTLESHFPPSVPPAFPFWLQAWIPDAGGPFGFAASNAIAGATP